MAASLAPAPVAVELVARLSPAGEVVELDETIAWGVAPSVYASTGEDVALRAHLNNPAPYGPMVRRTVLVGYVGDPLTVQELDLVGRLSAVERTAPDRETLRTWIQAGAHGAMAAGMPILKQAEVRPL